MAYEHIKDAALPKLLSNVVSDLVQLVSAEVRLAKDEISSNVSAKLHSVVWFAIAGIFGLVTLMLLAASAVFALAARGLDAKWAALAVAAGFCVLGGVSVAFAMAKASQDILPQRTVHQVNRDIRVIKDQLQ